MLQSLLFVTTKCFSTSHKNKSDSLYVRPNFLVGVSISFAELPSCTKPPSPSLKRLLAPGGRSPTYRKKHLSVGTTTSKWVIVVGLFSQYFSFLCYRQGFIVMSTFPLHTPSLHIILICACVLPPSVRARYYG